MGREWNCAMETARCRRAPLAREESPMTRKVNREDREDVEKSRPDWPLRVTPVDLSSAPNPCGVLRASHDESSRACNRRIKCYQETLHPAGGLHLRSRVGKLIQRSRRTIGGMAAMRG